MLLSNLWWSVQCGVQQPPATNTTYKVVVTTVTLTVTWRAREWLAFPCCACFIITSTHILQTRTFTIHSRNHQLEKSQQWLIKKNNYTITRMYLSVLSCLTATVTLHGGSVKQRSMSLSVLAFNFARPFLNDKPAYQTTAVCVSNT